MKTRQLSQCRPLRTYTSFFTRMKKLNEIKVGKPKENALKMMESIKSYVFMQMSRD